MGAIVYLQIRQIFGGRKIWFIALFLALPVALSAVIQYAGGFQPGGRPLEGEDRIPVVGIFLFVLYPQVACILLCLLYGAGLLSTEVEEKTITYLFTRSLPRWRIVVGKYIAAACSIWAAVTPSLVLSWLMFGAPGSLRFLLAFLVATLGAVFAYTAVFTALGVVIPKRAVVVGLIYAIVFEGALSFIPAIINTLTVNYYLRSLVLRIIPVPEASPNAAAMIEELGRVVGGESLPVCALALAMITAVALAFASLFATQRQYVVMENV